MKTGISQTLGSSSCASQRRVGGFTLVEIVVVLAVATVLAAITVPSVASVQGRAVVGAAARQLAMLLRRAQAAAQAGATRTQIQLTEGGECTYTELREGVWRYVAGASLGVLSCTTNYPGMAIEFSPRGWPCAAGSAVPRAGSFELSWAGLASKVVVQLTGDVRCE
jgi:prepilin-type N-terminal cleavage/methylation domain-containing protein